MSTRSLWTCGTTALALGLTAAPAMAQTEPLPPQADPTSSDVPAAQTPAEAARDDDAILSTGALREIVVTAQRRADSIQSVPVAVSALDEQALAEPSLKDIRDLAGRVPSLVVDEVNAGPSAAAISIRGISFEDIEKSFDPAVGVVVDGVVIGTNTGQLLDTFNLSSLEVLRGPQGTLFGRNTIAGVISVERKRPTGEFGVDGIVGYADFGSYRGRLAVNTPLIGGILALRPYILYDETDGYLYNQTLNRTAGRNRIITAGASALFTPTDRIEALINYEHVDQKGETVLASLSDDRDLICLRVPVPGVGLIRAFGIPSEECNRFALKDQGLYTLFQNIETPLRNKADSVTGQLSFEFGRFTLNSITGYQRNDEDVRLDFDASSINFFDVRRVQDYKQFSQELRFGGDVTEWLNVLVGAYYFDSSYDLDQFTNLGFANAALFQRTEGDSRSYAGFADARVKIGPVTLGGGGRYTSDRKAIFTNFGLSPDGSCPTFLGIATSACSGKQRFNKFTYRASADWQIDRDRLVYASYATGFRSGGFNGRASTPSSLGPYQPETVASYELGLKAEWLGRRVRTNVALFRTEYDNKQEEVVRATTLPFSAINPQETVVENAASATIQGAEVELIVAPTAALSFRASLSILDAEYDRFFRDVNGDLVPDDVSTLDLRRAPPISVSVGADYARDIGPGKVNASTTFRYLDRYTTCIVANRPAILGAVTNDNRCLTDDKLLLDASLGYTLGFTGRTEVSLTVFGRNLLDDRGINSTLPVAGLFTFAGVRQPRQFGAELGFRF